MSGKEDRRAAAILQRLHVLRPFDVPAGSLGGSVKVCQVRELGRRAAKILPHTANDFGTIIGCERWKREAEIAIRRPRGGEKRSDGAQNAAAEVRSSSGPEPAAQADSCL
jgi:hypothetical protein